jgi:hypothetical protein
MKFFVRFLLILTILFLFISTISQAAEKRYNIPVGDSPSWGPADAPVTVIEFLDYQ